MAIDDVGRALVELARPGGRPELVNLCSGVAVGFGEIVTALAAQLGVPARIASLDRPGIPAVVGDPARLQQLLGWRPVMSATRLAEVVLATPVPAAGTGSTNR